MDVLSLDESEKFLDLPSGGGGELLPIVISDLSNKLAAACGRTDWGPSEERTEYQDGGREFVLLNYWPVTAIDIYDDTEHDWGSGTEVADADYYTSDDGIVWQHSGGTFGDGFRSLKITYTAGYSNTAAVPAAVKTAGRMMLEREYAARNRPGREASGADLGELPPDVMRVLRPYVRRVPFA